MDGFVVLVADECEVIDFVSDFGWEFVDRVAGKKDDGCRARFAGADVRLVEVKKYYLIRRGLTVDAWLRSWFRSLNWHRGMLATLLTHLRLPSSTRLPSCSLSRE